MAGRITCKDANLFEAFACTWPPSSAFYKLLEIERKQQMQWSKSGVHLLLQTRVKTLDGELGTIFKRWYPDMDMAVEEMPAVA